MEQSSPGIPSPASSVVRSAVAALGAFATVIFFFSPRFAIWRGLHVPLAWFNPELIRVVDVLRQLQDPFCAIHNQTNAVLQGRLLFPLVGHFLRLPAGAFLALPAVGALLVLVVAGFLLLRRGMDPLRVFAVVAGLAATSWFFVSTGWLGYFDSWSILGGVAVVFFPSLPALGTACFLSPWVDERFLIALPLYYGLRRLRAREGSQPEDPPIRSEWVVIVGSLLIYALLRLALQRHWRHEGSAVYPGGIVFPTWKAGLAGCWHGLRAAWVFAAYGAARVFQKRGWKIAALLSALLVLTMAVLLPVARDLGRSISALWPAALLGAWMLAGDPRRKLSACVIYGCLALGLATPAYHVVTSFSARIQPLADELLALKSPPSFEDPLQLTLAGIESLRDQEPDRARVLLDAALRLEPSSCLALVAGGVLAESEQDPSRAEAEFQKAAGPCGDQFGPLRDQLRALRPPAKKGAGS